MRARPSATKARRTLLLAAAAIVSGELLIGLLMDQLGAAWRFPEAFHHARQVQAGVRPDILFFGSSRFSADVRADVVRHALEAAAPGRVVPVMNAWVSWGDAVAMEFVSARLTQEGARPSVVVIEVSPEMLSHRNFALDVHLVRQLTWADVPEIVPDAIRGGKLVRLITSRLNPAHDFRNEIQWGLIQVIRVPFLWGPPRPEPDEPLPTVLARGTAIAADRLRGFAIGGASAHRLERLIERHRATGATTILLRAPGSAPFRSGFPAPIDAAFLAHMRDLERRHGVRYVDYRARMPDVRFRSTYYLSDAGAVEFCRLVVHEVLAPLLAGGGTQTATASGPATARER